MANPPTLPSLNPLRVQGQPGQWQFNVNNMFLGNSGDRDYNLRRALFYIKQVMTGAAGVGAWTDSRGPGAGDIATTNLTGKWTVLASCNGGGANSGLTAGFGSGTGPADNWTDYQGFGPNNWGALVRTNWNNGNPGNHSWIVLKQTGIVGGSGYQICIDLTAQDDTFECLQLLVSPSAGFTGGALNRRPIATDEALLIQPYDIGGGTPRWFQQSSNNFDVRIFCWLSGDGQQTRIMALSTGGDGQGACKLFWAFEKAQNPIDAWATMASNGVSICTRSGNPSIAGNNANELTKDYWWNNALMNVRTTLNSGAWMSAESVAGNVMSVVVPVVNDLDSAGPFLPIGIVASAVGARGRLGTIGDLWFGARNIPFGDTYPGDGSKTFVQFGDFIFPWNKTVPAIQ